MVTWNIHSICQSFFLETLKLWLQSSAKIAQPSTTENCTVYTETRIEIEYWWKIMEIFREAEGVKCLWCAAEICVISTENHINAWYIDKSPRRGRAQQFSHRFFGQGIQFQFIKIALPDVLSAKLINLYVIFHERRRYFMKMATLSVFYSPNRTSIP